MFVFVREYVDKIGREAVMFSFFLRVQVLLVWVIGLSLVYVLAMGFSFTVMYLSVAVAFIVCGVMVWLFLSSMRKEFSLAIGTIEASRRNRRDTLLLFVICILMWGSNSLYIINMSLFIINELYFFEKLVGVMMGIVVGLEISTMLIVGYFVKRLGKRFLMRVVVVGGVCFYVGMLMAYLFVILLGLQLLNVIFIGILGGIGMFYFQDLMFGQAGLVITFYINISRVGWIIVGLVAGIVVEIWNYYVVFWFAMVMIIVILFCLLRIKDV